MEMKYLEEVNIWPCNFHLLQIFKCQYLKKKKITNWTSCTRKTLMSILRIKITWSLALVSFERVSVEEYAWSKHVNMNSALLSIKIQKFRPRFNFLPQIGRQGGRKLVPLEFHSRAMKILAHTLGRGWPHWSVYTELDRGAILEFLWSAFPTFYIPWVGDGHTEAFTHNGIRMPFLSFPPQFSLHFTYPG